MKKQGFTLAETLVTMGIIGVCAMICIPVVMGQKPNQDIVMCKKAYYTVERVVSELINDEDLYSSAKGSGLDNTDKEKITGADCSGNTKFCCLFKEKVNHMSATCPSSGTGSVQTSDGITYNLPISNFSSAQSITVDVNPNGTGTTSSPDTFTFTVNKFGRITVDANAQVYLKTKKLNAKTVTAAAK